MRRLGTPVVLTLAALAFVVLIGLGAWQLARNGYKQDLTRERDAAIAAAPLPAAEAATLSEAELEYRRIALEGEWDYGRAQLVGNRTRFGLRGEEVYVPLLLPGGGPAILVNRGWYPLAERDAVLAALPSDAPPEALVRPAPGVPASRAGDGAWTRLDIGSIAAELPYSVAPWQAIAGELQDPAPNRLPAQRPVTGFEGFTNTTPHIEYALTWFGLAAVLVASMGVRIWQRRRGEEPRANALGRKASDGHEAA